MGRSFGSSWSSTRVPGRWEARLNLTDPRNGFRGDGSPGADSGSRGSRASRRRTGTATVAGHHRWAYRFAAAREACENYRRPVRVGALRTMSRAGGCLSRAAIWEPAHGAAAGKGPGSGFPSARFDPAADYDRLRYEGGAGPAEFPLASVARREGLLLKKPSLAPGALTGGLRLSARVSRGVQTWSTTGSRAGGAAGARRPPGRERADHARDR